MRKSVLALTTLALLGALLLSACGVATKLIPQQAEQLIDTVKSAQAQSTTSEAESIDIQPGLLAAYTDALSQIYEKVNPSVVNIRVVQKLDAGALQEVIPGLPFDLPNIPGLPQLPGGEDTPEEPDVPQYGQGLGSGFVWDEQGHVITNNHVVAGADKIEVTFSDGTVASAELVGADPDSDLAVLMVEVSKDLLQPVVVADSEAVKVGQLAIAIGNPFGLDGTMTVGIVSALGRTLPTAEGVTTGPSYSIPDIIQTDAPINPGNSGGVLVDDQGRVIGVTAAIESPVRANAGIGFVIPASIVQRVVPELIKNGSYAHPYLGIQGLTLTPDLARLMDLDENQHGALVAELMPDSPAENAGLRGSEQNVEIDGQEIQVGGDVIVAIDGQPVKEMDDLIAYLGAHTRVDQKVTLTVLRDGKEIEIAVTLKARPREQEEPEKEEPKQATAGVFLGIGGAPLTPELTQSLDLPEDQTGVLVQEVQADTPADRGGIEVNDIITALDGKDVKDVETLREMLQKHQAGDEVTLTILRDGEQMEITVTLAERS